MPTVRQPVVEDGTRGRTFGLGSSGSDSLRAAFSTSPLYDGTYSHDDQVRNDFENPPELNDGYLNDGGNAFGEPVARYYQGAPDLSTVVVGGGGLPGSPYAPNIASPGDGNGFNYTAIPAAGAIATESQRGGGGFGVGDGLASPSEVIPRIAPRTIGQGWFLGRSSL